MLFSPLRFLINPSLVRQRRGGGFFLSSLPRLVFKTSGLMNASHAKQPAPLWPSHRLLYLPISPPPPCSLAASTLAETHARIRSRCLTHTRTRERVHPSQFLLTGSGQKEGWLGESTVREREREI